MMNLMAKRVAFLGVAVMVVALCGCGGRQDEKVTSGERKGTEETDVVWETVSDAISEAPTAEEKSETQTEQIEENRERETFPESEETHDTAVDKEVLEDDEALELWNNEMEAVDNAILELMQSEGFDDLETTEKVEKMLALINGLAANGTEEYNYPLIKAETIYYDGDDMITFEYAGGGLGGAKLEPFDPMFN